MMPPSQPRFEVKNSWKNTSPPPCFSLTWYITEDHWASVLPSKHNDSLQNTSRHDYSQRLAIPLCRQRLLGNTSVNNYTVRYCCSVWFRMTSINTRSKVRSISTISKRAFIYVTLADISTFWKIFIDWYTHIHKCTCTETFFAKDDEKIWEKCKIQ